ncbi:MAG: inositol monophosphatase [Thermodesulfovibrionales bacterium]|nr:inositol monophosphatase [Thermodesulfovibrionales bacterium]
MLDDFMDVARSSAIKAGQYIVSMCGSVKNEDIDTKTVGDFVTHVDKESESMIIDEIRNRYPNHSFLAEESGKSADSEYCWVVDPLDGTTNFIHGFPVFAVSIALQHRGEFVLGVVYDPNTKEMFEAIKGKGAFLNGKRIHVSKTKEMKKSLVATGFPFRQKGIVDKYVEIFKEMLLEVGDLRRAGSAAIDLVYVACGRCDGFFEFGLKVWDIAAGSLIVKEAGGYVSGFYEDEDLYQTGNIVSGNKYIFQNLKDIIKRHL